ARVPPGERRLHADDLLELVADEVEEGLVRRDELTRLRIADGERNRHRVEERVEVALVEHLALVLGGDVPEDDHRAVLKRGDAAVEDELAPVEGGRAEAEARGDPALARLLAREAVGGDLVRLALERARREERRLERDVVGDREDRAGGG